MLCREVNSPVHKKECPMYKTCFNRSQKYHFGCYRKQEYFFIHVWFALIKRPNWLLHHLSYTWKSLVWFIHEYLLKQHVTKSKLHLMVRIQFWNFEECGFIHLLPWLPGLLWPGLVVPVRFQSIDHLDLFRVMKCLPT